MMLSVWSFTLLKLPGWVSGEGWGWGSGGLRVRVQGLWWGLGFWVSLGFTVQGMRFRQGFRASGQGSGLGVLGDFGFRAGLRVQVKVAGQYPGFGMFSAIVITVVVVICVSSALPTRIVATWSQKDSGGGGDMSKNNFVCSMAWEGVPKPRFVSNPRGHGAKTNRLEGKGWVWGSG